MGTKAEFGDFQTPEPLARAVCEVLAELGIAPRSVLEPTCGRGAFLAAAVATWPGLEQAVGVDIDADHLRAAARRVGGAAAVRLERGDFFAVDWSSLVATLPDPFLVLGNPPWVTSAGMGAMGGSNLPVKENIDRLRGFEAVTGRSNFDISEWMLLRALEWVAGRRGVIAVLCKTAVARRVLARCWQEDRAPLDADLFALDAYRHFDARVDAGLLVLRTESTRRSRHCAVHAGLAVDDDPRAFGWRDGELVAELATFDRWRALLGGSDAPWRSGIKHDCSAVMELTRGADGAWVNGLGEPVDVEPTHVYPMLKSSHISGRAGGEARFMLVPQRAPGEDTASIARRAPRTSGYLERHAERLAARRSTIWRGLPRFAVFGVGDYSFAPWKVAISGFYRGVRFAVVGPRDGRPVVLDDTCYFLPFEDEAAARFVAAQLGAAPAQEALRAFVFPDAKRPVTKRLLQRLDLVALAELSGEGPRMRLILADVADPEAVASH